MTCSNVELDVHASGIVLLGDISCDGFRRENAVRIQTNLTIPHMNEFTTSKGMQSVYLSVPAKKLLQAEYNADLLHRENVIGMPFGETFDVSGNQVTLVANDTMLGSSQVMVVTKDGTRVGYSGLFSWPSKRIIKVDALVLDCGCRNLESVAEYNERAARKLFERISRGITNGPVNIVFSKGVFENMLKVVSNFTGFPFIMLGKTKKQIEVLQDYIGLLIEPIVLEATDDAREAKRSRKYIRLIELQDYKDPDDLRGNTIFLNAHSDYVVEPVFEYLDELCRISFSIHPSVDGLVEYVAATGAQYVVTDSSRSTNAEDISRMLIERLGIESRPSSNLLNRSWGAG